MLLIPRQLYAICIIHENCIQFKTDILSFPQVSGSQDMTEEKTGKTFAKTGMMFDMKAVSGYHENKF